MHRRCARAPTAMIVVQLQETSQPLLSPLLMHQGYDLLCSIKGRRSWNLEPWDDVYCCISADPRGKAVDTSLCCQVRVSLLQAAARGIEAPTWRKNAGSW